MINIIGAGMAGSILAKLLRLERIPFRIFDSEQPGRASIVSENLIGLDWYKTQQVQVNKALVILGEIVPVRTFQSGKSRYYHVYTDFLLEQDYIHAHVTGLINNGCHANYSSGFNYGFFPGFNVVCAGFWSKQFGVDVEGVVGHGFIAENKQANPEVIKLYKPFRFEKFINRNRNEVWYSNSLKVSEKTYANHQEKYIDELTEGAKNFINFETDKPRYMTGIRPLTASHTNIEIENGLVITGGYTSGMLYYPLQALDAVAYIKKNVRY